MIAAGGNLPLRSWPLFYPRHEQVDYLSDSGRTDIRPAMGSEDFSFILNEVPGAYVFLGNGDTAGVHNHRYDFNDEAIPYGAALYAAIVERKLPKGQP